MAWHLPYEVQTLYIIIALNFVLHLSRWLDWNNNGCFYCNVTILLVLEVDNNFHPIEIISCNLLNLTQWLLAIPPQMAVFLNFIHLTFISLPYICYFRWIQGFICDSYSQSFLHSHCSEVKSCGMLKSIKINVLCFLFNPSTWVHHLLLVQSVVL